MGTTVSVSINYPDPGNVSGNGAFDTYGTYTITPTMSVTITSWINIAATGAFVANGTETTPPTGQDWEFKYSGLTCGVPYVLTVQVQGADGSIAASQINITCTSP